MPYRYVLLMIFACVSQLVFADETLQTHHQRPKIALVLSGGGAKGTAHVGVLKVLEEMRVPVDYVVGTSIGSVVGGLYALGYSADEIEQRMLGVDFNRGYSDAIPREDLPYRNKQYHDQFNIPLEVGVEKGSVELPAGVLYGQSMRQLLRDLTGLVPQQASFDNLVIPYRAVATNLASRDAVVIDKGSIITAMRASSSVPGALAPVDYQGLLLVDGGIANNIPVALGKSLGADIIIAVNIGSPLKTRDEIAGGQEVIGIVGQLTGFLTNEGSERQIAKMAPHDILIVPDITDMSTTDFSIMPKALLAGETAARAVAAQLSALSVSDEEYQQYLQAKKQSHEKLVRPSVKLNKVAIKNNSPVHRAYIRKNFHINAGDEISQPDLNEAIASVYSLDEFQRVDAELYPRSNGETELRLRTEDKSWSPNIFGFGFGWEEELSGDTAFNFDLSYTLHNLTNEGAEWRNQIELGEDRSLRTEFYAPLTVTRWLYSRVQYNYQTEILDMYVNNQQLTRVDRNAHIGELGLGWNFHQSGFLEVGVEGQAGYISGAFFNKREKFTTQGAYFKWGYDSLDNINFPTQGRRLVFEYYQRSEDVINQLVNGTTYVDRQYDSSESTVNWKGALNLGNHSLVTKAVLSRVDSDTDNSVFITRLGGFLDLSGYHHNALSGSQKVLMAMIYQWDLGRSLLDLSKYPLYLGVSVEKGNVSEEHKWIEFGDMITAGSLFLGTNTQFGPAAIGFGSTSDGNQALYLFIGKGF